MASATVYTTADVWKLYASANGALWMDAYTTATPGVFTTATSSTVTPAVSTTAASSAVTAAAYIKIGRNQQGVHTESMLTLLPVKQLQFGLLRTPTIWHGSRIYIIM